MKRLMGLMVCLMLAIVVMVPSSSTAATQAMVVDRLYDIEGELLRYVPEENYWVAVVRNARKRSDTGIKAKSSFGYLFADLYKGWQIRSDIKHEHYGVRLTHSW
jgi:putative cell wall-binding protein